MASVFFDFTSLLVCVFCFLPFWQHYCGNCLVQINARRSTNEINGFDWKGENSVCHTQKC